MVEHELPKLGARVRFPSPARQRLVFPEHEALRIPEHAPLGRRVISWLWDYAVILVWLLLVFLFVGLPQLQGWIDPAPIWTDQNSSDVGITLLTVLPFLAYLFFTEASRSHATWGKRRTGIVVQGTDDSSPSLGSVAVRNLIKVAPWQLGHMGTMRLINTVEATSSAVAFQVASLALLALIVLPVLFRRRGIHDLLAGTHVATKRETASGSAPDSS